MSNPLHIIFAGTPEFAVPSLRALAGDAAFVIDVVLTQPDEPVGRKQVLTAPPVKRVAEELGLTVLQPKKMNDMDLSALHCDFLVVVAYGQILSDAVLALPSIAPVNVHASLLPRWRGASPIQHAILRGDKETGVTIQRMVKELDAGPVFSDVSTPIGPRETFPDLHDRLAMLGAELLVNTLKKLPKPSPQDETKATLCRKLTRADGTVDPRTMTAEEIDRHVRALVPWPGVRMTIEGEELKILETMLEPVPGAIPVACKEGTLYLTKIQPSGKKPMTGEEWKRGRR